jgi:hypothetical protein
MTAEFALLLASALPDVGQASFVPLMGSVGFFVGGLLARLRGVPLAARSHWMSVGTWVGIGVGGAIWFLTYAIDRL